MSIFKCKMCGGTLETNNNETVGVCEYCGTKQTLPKNNDEVITNLFNRANNLRLKCEFDKATQIYEKIVEQDATEAEAYWGMVLCKYGIEYVEDSKTFERIPTCHRTLYEAVTSDVDYIAAVEHADLAQRMLYEKEAKAIENIQKDILNIVKNEKPFDVFICYKETDETGKRTVDSVIANDIYHELTEEGFKVFYSAITLEEKLGQEYEPYIFAALSSAKVMLVIGTKPEYFEAVWVKNEWGRFLKLMKQDRSKLLIPCYKDMDAYELPEDFAHLQAQDMGKIGFINDVIRGIKKVLLEEETELNAKETVVVNAAGVNTDALLERAFMFLEDGAWNSADEYCEKVLDIEPKNAMAYLGKLMAELRMKKREELAKCEIPFDDRNNYQKAVKFADGTLKASLEGYINTINERNELQFKEEIYNKALGFMGSNVAEDILKARQDFILISGYKNAELLAKKCAEKAETVRKTAIYNQATAKMEDNNTWFLEQAVELFESIKGWSDADEKADECRRKIERMKIEAERIEKRNRRLAKILIPTVILAIVFIIVLVTVIIPNSKYSKAITLMEKEKYEESIAIFTELDGHKDSAKQIELCETAIKEQKYNEAVKLMNAGEYEISIGIFTELENYQDSAEQIAICEIAIKDQKYNEAVELMNAGKYDEAISIFKSVETHKDSQEQIVKSIEKKYAESINALKEGRLAAVYQQLFENASQEEIKIIFREYPDSYEDTDYYSFECKFYSINGRIHMYFDDGKVNDIRWRGSANRNQYLNIVNTISGVLGEPTRSGGRTVEINGLFVEGKEWNDFLLIYHNWQDGETTQINFEIDRDEHPWF